jgi:DNA-binding protein YbaB
MQPNSLSGAAIEQIRSQILADLHDEPPPVTVTTHKGLITLTMTEQSRIVGLDLSDDLAGANMGVLSQALIEAFDLARSEIRERRLERHQLAPTAEA